MISSQRSGARPAFACASALLLVALQGHTPTMDLDALGMALGGNADLQKGSWPPVRNGHNR
jgi:hypothetical protein